MNDINIEKKVLELFLYQKKLKFSDIEKSLRTRSNKLSYHLKNMIRKELLVKSDDSYSLSKSSETLIPYISEKTTPLPVILIMISKSEKVFLVRREKRPFKNKLALPAGRIMIGEDIEEAVKRIMKEKYGIDAEYKKTNSVSIERVGNKEKTIHSFLLILTSAITKKKINYYDINKSRKEIIGSDWQLIKNDEKKKILIKNYYTKDL